MTQIGAVLGNGSRIKLICHPMPTAQEPDRAKPGVQASSPCASALISNSRSLKLRVADAVLSSEDAQPIRNRAPSIRSGEVVQNGLRCLSEGDLRAMMTYLLDSEVVTEDTFAALPTAGPKFD